MSRSYKKNVLFSNNNYEDYVKKTRYKIKMNHEHTPSYWKNYFARKNRQDAKEYLNRLIKDLENEDKYISPKPGKGDVFYKIW